jgi:hypothetical protein
MAVSTMTRLWSWMPEESWFDSRQRQDIFFFTRASWPYLGPTRLPNQFSMLPDTWMTQTFYMITSRNEHQKWTWPLWTLCINYFPNKAQLRQFKSYSSIITQNWTPVHTGSNHGNRILRYSSPSVMRSLSASPGENQRQSVLWDWWRERLSSKHVIRRVSYLSSSLISLSEWNDDDKMSYYYYYDPSGLAV